MTDTEELIKAALAKGAERAPHPGRVINALNSPPRRRIRGALIALIGAVVIGAAFTAPIVFRQSAEPMPPAASELPPPVAETVALKYGVTHVPPGYGEIVREADIGGGQQHRGWQNGQNLIHLSVYTPRSPRWQWATLPTIDQVEIGRAPGWVAVGDDTFTQVTFMPDQDTLVQVQVHGPPRSREKAIEVANSVRPDGVTTVVPPLSFGTMPPRFTRIAMSIRGSSPATGEAWLTASSDDAMTPEVQARLVAKGSTKLHGWNVTVPTPDGREIELVYNSDSKLSEQQALEIAEDMTVGAKPDFSWLGK
jgi:hypothetical protein